MAKKFKFTVGAQFSVVIGKSAFYATAKQIRFGIGDFGDCNRAVARALQELEFRKNGTGECAKTTCGVGGTWEGIQVSLTVKERSTV